jgi:hypothetical protein
MSDRNLPGRFITIATDTDGYLWLWNWSCTPDRSNAGLVTAVDSINGASAWTQPHNYRLSCREYFAESAL